MHTPPKKQKLIQKILQNFTTPTKTNSNKKIINQPFFFKMKMRHQIKRVFSASRRFKNEFRIQLRSFIILTLAFTIAFSWRQTTFDLSQKFVQFLLNIKSSNSLTIITSIFLTIACGAIILITSNWLKEKPGYYH